MVKMDLVKKVCSGNCSEADFIVYEGRKKKDEYDIVDSFNKYYTLRAILRMIERYEQGEIGVRFLANWANAYNWIITGGFASEEYDTTIKRTGLKEIVVWEIADWLDSLSFLDTLDECCDLSGYKAAFNFLDAIYQNMQDWKVFFAPKTDLTANEGDADALFVNQRKKIFAKIFCCWFEEEQYAENIEQISFTEMEEKIKQITQEGYERVSCGYIE